MIETAHLPESAQNLYLFSPYPDIRYGGCQSGIIASIISLRFLR